MKAELKFSKEYIENLLATNDKAVIRALLALNERQTKDEKESETTFYKNGRGFRPCHAHRGTSMAKFFNERGFLTQKQIDYWRIPSKKTGKPRISIYAGQLAEIANSKHVSN
jgi:hypothetical protein